MTFPKLLAFTVLLLLWSCKVPLSQPKQSIPPAPAHFANVLNLNGIPNDYNDRSIFSFSDMGAWFGYSLPDNPQYHGSFSGPFLMTQDNGVWISPCLSQMEVYDPYTGEIFDLQKAKHKYSISLPGRLRQGFELERPRIRVQTELIFATNRTALIHINILPLDDSQSLTLGVSWRGMSLAEGFAFGKGKNGIRLRSSKNKTVGAISFSEKYPVILYASKDQYQISYEQNDISPVKGWQIAMTQSFCFDTNELNQELQKVDEILAEPKRELLRNDKRWTAMLKDVLTEKVDSTHHRLAVKCLQTLVTNWRSPAGFMEHGGLFPSYNYEWFHGFWAWDSWKHAVAVAKFNPELAQNQILAMFDFQNERGMIVDCYYRDTVIEQHNWRNTKPPLAAWAAWEVFEHSHDTQFLRDVYPKLARYHDWWYKDRDHNQNGLCEYGSTDGTLKAAKWESGMDNAVRFDSASIVQNNEFAWSMNQESVDLNAYLYAEKHFLMRICDQIGEDAQRKQYEEKAAKLAATMKEVFFDSESGWYYDVRLDDQSFIKVMGPEGWIPLWAEIATPKQADAMHKVLMDTTKFATYIPFPTLAADHPKFSPQNGYWRGPVWLDQAYFALEGMKKYGYKEDVTQFRGQLFDRLEGLKAGQTPIRENYHPLTGQGLESNHFSWSAAHLLLMLWEE